MAANQQVYLDHQASSPVLPEVLEAMRPYWSEWFGSPASQHSLGLRARDALEEARHLAAGMIGAESPEDILFTSGATESANLALKGAAFASRERGNHIVLTAIEHPSVLNSALWLESQGFKCTRVGCDPRGVVDPDDIRAAITSKTILVAIHHANHDIGTIQAIDRISGFTREKGIPFFFISL